MALPRNTAGYISSGYKNHQISGSGSLDNRAQAHRSHTLWQLVHTVFWQAGSHLPYFLSLHAGTFEDTQLTRVMPWVSSSDKHPIHFGLSAHRWPFPYKQVPTCTEEPNWEVSSEQFFWMRFRVQTIPVCQDSAIAPDSTATLNLAKSSMERSSPSQLQKMHLKVWDTPFHQCLQLPNTQCFLLIWLYKLQQQQHTHKSDLLQSAQRAPVLCVYKK